MQPDFSSFDLSAKLFAMSHPTTTASLSQLSGDVRDALTDWLAECDLHWQLGQIESRLNVLPTDLQPFRSVALAELVKIDIVQMWKRKQKTLLETYLEEFPELGTVETAAADLIVAELEARKLVGPRLTDAELEARFPRQADAVRSLVTGQSLLADGGSLPSVRKLTLADTELTQAEDTNTSGRTAQTIPETFQAGDRIGENGRFHILKELGHGGMGAVFLATDSKLGRDVAIKVPQRAALDSPDLLDRFRSEAECLAMVSHANLPVVHDVSEFGGVPFVVMDYIDGISLGDFLQTNTLTPQRAVEIVRDVADALSAAHAKGIVHRDMKPDNIMLTQQQQPKVIDFGLALNVARTGPRKTQVGTLLGTPHYMPMEQMKGDVAAIGPRSDVYSLGVVLYKLLTGTVPFPGHQFHEVLTRMTTEETPSPLQYRFELDLRLTALVLKAIEKKPEDRYQSMPEFAQALQDYLTPSTAVRATPPRRTARVAMAAMSFLVLLGVILYFQNGNVTIKVEVLADDVEVTFQKDSLTIADGEHKYQVKPGEHRLHIKIGNAEFDTDNFKLTRGDDVKATIELVDSKVITKLGDATIGAFPAATSKNSNLIGERGGVSPPVSLTKTRDGSTKNRGADTAPLANRAKGNSDHDAKLAVPPPVGELKPGEWHDLLAMVKLPDHVVFGSWQRNENGSIGCDHSDIPALMVPVVIDGGYELSGEFVRLNGPDMASCAFPVGAGDVSVLMGGWRGGYHGLSGINGHVTNEEKATWGAVVPPGRIETGKLNQWHVDVARSGDDAQIVATLNGTEIASWKGDTHALTRHSEQPLAYSRFVSLHAYQSAVEFRSLKLRLKPQARAMRVGDDWANPLNPVAAEPPADIADQCVRWKDRAYYFSDKPLTLVAAQYLAHQLKGRLLTVSSQAEENFLAANDGGRSVWMSGWKRHDLNQWRDERNRPLRFIGRWSKNEPQDDINQSRLSLWPTGLGWSNQRRQESFHACIEWGEEYAPGSTDALVIVPPKVAKAESPRPKDEPWVDPNLSRKPNVIHGKWWFEGDELVTESVAPRNLITFGDVDWTDYDLKVEASCDAIGVSYNLFLRWFKDDYFWLLQFGNYGAKNMDLVAYVPGEFGWRMPTRRYMPNSLHGEAKVWHNIEVKVRGDNIIVIVDGIVMTTSSHPKLSHGCVGMHTFSPGNARWRNLEVRTPDGKLMWKGFPDLSDNAAK